MSAADTFTQVHVYGDPDEEMAPDECWCDDEQFAAARVIYHRSPGVLSALSRLWFCDACGQLSGEPNEA